jgi:predicted RNA-binding protein with PUA-like domain
MAYWLMKSEPPKYSWDDLVRDGRTHWDGVRNNQAALYLKAMAVGDEALLYHSNEGLAAVGIMKVVRTAYPDPSDEKGRFVMVDVAPLRPLARPVTLAAMKAEPRLAAMAMFRQFRLSVAPLTDAEWSVMMEMAGS